MASRPSFPGGKPANYAKISNDVCPLEAAHHGERD
jgi:hypothetical protein